jgi:haloalkane dehalogenase
MNAPHTPDENITRVFEPLMQQRIPGARGRNHITVPNRRHFVQEHQPQLLVDVILQLSSPHANASASQR